MSTETFKQAIAQSRTKPKVVLVSIDLFRALEEEKAISRKIGTPWGLSVPSFGIELPYYDGDVLVFPDLRMNGHNYKIPE